MEQIKISLQDAVFSRCAMNDDVCEVEHFLFLLTDKAEIITVNRDFCIIRKHHFPTQSFHLHNVDFIFVLVDERIDPLRTAKGYGKLRRISPCNNCNYTFHIFM